VYKNYDHRAKIIRKVAEEVFSILGKEPLIEVAVELERIALSDPFFVERKLYPNVDFYSGLIYKSMGREKTTTTAVLLLRSRLDPFAPAAALSHCHRRSPG